MIMTNKTERKQSRSFLFFIWLNPKRTKKKEQIFFSFLLQQSNWNLVGEHLVFSNTVRLQRHFSDAMRRVIGFVFDSVLNQWVFRLKIALEKQKKKFFFFSFFFVVLFIWSHVFRMNNVCYTINFCWMPLWTITKHKLTNDFRLIGVIQHAEVFRLFRWRHSRSRRMKI